MTLDGKVTFAVAPSGPLWLDVTFARLAEGMRGDGDIVLFSCASVSEFRLGAGAKRPTLIEPVNDVTGACQAPIGSSR